MSENKKKGWLRAVIAVFILAMLLLTLFSNTIMNRSLPEVAVQNATSGTITTQVKVNGTVSANKTKEVKLDGARTVDTVLAHRGDTVSRGDVLATLVAGESEDIYNLEVELAQMQIEYKKMLMDEADSLTETRYALEDARADLADVQQYLADLPGFEAKKQGIEDHIKVLEGQIETQEKLISAEEKQIEDLNKQMKKLTDPGMDSTKLHKAIDEAKDALSDAKKAYNAAKRTRSDASSTYDTATRSYNEAEDAFNAADKAYSAVKKELDTLSATLAAAQSAYASLVTKRDGLAARIAEIKAIAEENRTESEKSELTEKETELAEVKGQISAKKAEIDETQSAISAKEAELAPLVEPRKAALDEMNTRLATMNAAFGNYTSADAAEKSAKSAYDAAEDRLDDLNDGFEYALLQSRVDEHNDNIDEMKDVKATYEDDLADAKEDLAEAEKDITKTEKEAKKEETTLLRSIAGYEETIRLAKANGKIDDETDNLALDLKRTQISRKQKEIEKLKAKVTATEIVAPVSGTIGNVGISSGDDAADGTTAFEIIMNENGYTMDCVVTNAQAARLNVGQQAEVQYYYWGDKPRVSIAAIKSDTNSGGKNKIVTFAVEGDIADGTSLTVTVGSRGANYDTIVPNSAIREDADGKFILLLVTKSSPLGSRYFAERRKVEVLASDATQSAVDATLGWGDYVITNASVPISDGMQVRMSQ